MESGIIRKKEKRRAIKLLNFLTKLIGRSESMYNTFYDGCGSDYDTICFDDDYGSRKQNKNQELNNDYLLEKKMRLEQEHKAKKKELFLADIEEFKKVSIDYMKLKYGVNTKFELPHKLFGYGENYDFFTKMYPDWKPEMVLSETKDNSINKLNQQVDNIYKLIKKLEAEKNEILAI